MAFIAELIITILLISAGVFGLVGSFGLIKLPDMMTRLHAPTKATTLGVGSVLIASMLYSFVFGVGLSFHELMITLFLFLTAPITAHFVAKAEIHRNVPEDQTPKPVGSVKWAGYTDPSLPAGQSDNK